MDDRIGHLLDSAQTRGEGGGGAKSPDLASMGLLSLPMQTASVASPPRRQGMLMPLGGAPQRRARAKTGHACFSPGGLAVAQRVSPRRSAEFTSPIEPSMPQERLGQRAAPFIPIAEPKRVSPRRGVALAAKPPPLANRVAYRPSCAAGSSQFTLGAMRAPSKHVAHIGLNRATAIALPAIGAR